MFLAFRLKLKYIVATVLVLAAVITVAGTVSAVQNSQPHTVYLTFDDGPSQYTPELLEVLKNHDVKATFFVCAQCEDYLPVIKRAHEDGHLIALHTYSHKYSQIYESTEAFWGDIGLISAEVEELTGERSMYLRFPGGSSNTLANRYGGRGIMKTLTEQCGEMGFIYYDWNVDTRDAVGEVKSAEYISSRAIKGASKERYAVILMHDGPASETVAQATDIIISDLLSRGYAFDTLDNLVSPIHHSLA